MTDRAAEAPTIAPDATTRLLDTVLAQGETIATLRERVGRAEALAEPLAIERAAVMLERDELRETVEQTLRDRAETLRAAEARAAKLAADLERERRRPWWRKVWG